MNTIVTDDEILGEAEFPPMGEDGEPNANNLSGNSNQAASEELSAVQGSIQALEPESIGAAIVLALKYREQRTTSGQTKAAEADDIPSFSGLQDLEPELRRFLAARAVRGGSNDPYGILGDAPASEIHKIIVDRLLEATRDHFFKIFNDLDVLCAARVTDDDLSYQEQVASLQAQGNEIWEDEQLEGQMPELCYAVRLDHEVIEWQSDFLPHMRNLDWEYGLLAHEET